MVEEESPGAQQRADGDIEGTPRTRTPVKRALQKGEGLRVGRHGRRCSVSTDTRKLAGRPIVAKFSFNPINAIEGFLCKPIRGRLVLSVEVQAEHCSHGVVSLVKQLQRLLGVGVTSAGGLQEAERKTGFGEPERCRAGEQPG
jgi:hypothetical protein